MVAPDVKLASKAIFITILNFCPTLVLYISENYSREFSKKKFDEHLDKIIYRKMTKG